MFKRNVGKIFLSIHLLHRIYDLKSIWFKIWIIAYNLNWPSWPILSIIMLTLTNKKVENYRNTNIFLNKISYLNFLSLLWTVLSNGYQLKIPGKDVLYICVARAWEKFSRIPDRGDGWSGSLPQSIVGKKSKKIDFCGAFGTELWFLLKSPTF